MKRFWERTVSEMDELCAHLSIKWTTKQNEDGSTTGWWECPACKLKFAPVCWCEIMMEKLRAELLDAQATAQTMANVVSHCLPYEKLTPKEVAARDKALAYPAKKDGE